MCVCVCVCARACIHAKLLQECLTFCDPMNCILPGSSLRGILQARILEWVAMLSSRGSFLTQGSNPCLLHLLHWQVGSLPLVRLIQGFPGGSDGKESTHNTGDLGLIPGLGRSPGEGNDNPFQYSCLMNPMDRGASWAVVREVAKNWT